VRVRGMGKRKVFHGKMVGPQGNKGKKGSRKSKKVKGVNAELEIEDENSAGARGVSTWEHRHAMKN